MMHYLQVSKPEIVQHVVDGEYMPVLSPLFPFSRAWCSQQVGRLSTSANSAGVGTKAYTVAMFSKEFQEWKNLTTHKSDSTWRTDRDVPLAIPLAIVMSLLWASWFQFFNIVLSLLKMNLTSSQVLHDPRVVITAIFCATQFTIAAQPTTTFVAELALTSALLVHVLLVDSEMNKVTAGVIITCTFFKAVISQI